MTSAEKILAKCDKRVVPISIPEWGDDGEYYLRSISAKERIALKHLITKAATENDEGIVQATVCTIGLSDAKGNRIFSDEQAALVADKDAAVLDRICDAFFKHIGLRDEAAEAEKKA
jgi:hypothetical protein